MKLTVKQEAFCLAYIETGNASEAYRRAYSAGKMKPESIRVNAGKLLVSTTVALRISELQAKAAERNAVTVDDLIAELEEARQSALGALIPQSSAAVASTMGKAKILGFLTDKVDATVATNNYSFSVRRAGSEL
jgi:phage terminase small subunit